MTSMTGESMYETNPYGDAVPVPPTPQPMAQSEPPRRPEDVPAGPQPEGPGGPGPVEQPSREDTEEEERDEEEPERAG